MLSGEAVRLAALEVLCPKAALDAKSGYPTLAGHRILDSQEPGLHHLDPDTKYTPVASLYTADSSVRLRGDAATFDDSEATTTLEIVAELAIASTDENGANFVDAASADDWQARLTLLTFCAQIRRLLQYSDDGALFRRFVKSFNRVTEETFSVPQLGARWQRVTMRFELGISDDEFVDGAGLPEPLATLKTLLPEGSKARDRLLSLEAHFVEISRTPLASVDYDDPGTDSKFMTGEPPTP